MVLIAAVVVVVVAILAHEASEILGRVQGGLKVSAGRLPRGSTEVHFINIISLMGAADIINPNAGISALTGKSAYIGPDPDVVTHLYGIAALL